MRGRGGRGGLWSCCPEVEVLVKKISHSISLTGAQAIPVFKIGLGRRKGGRVVVGLVGVTDCVG